MGTCLRRKLCWLSWRIAGPGAIDEEFHLSASIWPSNQAHQDESQIRAWHFRAVDCLLIGLVFAAFASGHAPDVNEAHYLTKARQFWQPDWLPQDLFLASSFPHWLFYVTFGWLTVVFDFVAAAWIGRILGWLMLAIGWEALANAFELTRMAKIASAIALIALVQVGNLSGEWLVGGIEAKIPAYALVFFALSRAVRDEWRWVWPALGVACGFHVLVGGWSFSVCLIARATIGRRQRGNGPELVLVLCGLVLAVGLGVLPSLIADLGVDQVTRKMAARIYVRERIGHHLYFWDFSRTSILLFALLVFGWRELTRESRERRLALLHCFAAAAVALTLGGIGLSAWRTGYSSSPGRNTCCGFIGFD